MGDNTGGGNDPPPVNSADMEVQDNETLRTENVAQIISTQSTENIQKDEEILLYNDKDQGPYYVFIESTDDNKKGVGRMHPMSIGQLMKKLFPDTEILKLFKNGRNRIKIQLSSRSKANKIIQSPELKAANLKAYVPRFILFRHGIVRGVDTTLSEQDILEEIQPMFLVDAKIVAVRRFNRRVIEENVAKYVPTGTIQVTFRAQSLPTHISIYYVRCEVEKYVPKVLQCRKCLRFGHTEKSCKGQIRCSNCAENHPDDQCDKTQSEPKCVHCSGPHSSRVNFRANICPELEKQKSINNLMVNENITFFEARSKLSSSFASTVQNNQDNSFEISRVNSWKNINMSSSSSTSNEQQQIRPLQSVRTQMSALTTPERTQNKKRLRQESPQNLQNQQFIRQCQEASRGYQYDQNQFENGVCLNKDISSGNEHQKKTVAFENLDKLSNFIRTIISSTVGIVGSSKKITQNELTNIIEKELLQTKNKNKKNVTFGGNLLSSSEDDS